MKKVLIAVMVVVLFVTSVMFAADQLVQAKLANIRVLLNGSPIELKDATGAMVKPLSYKDTTYLPVRAISENLGLTVGWDEATQTVSLTSSSTQTNKSDMNFIPNNRVGYKIGETWVVPGQWELTIDSVVEMKERNQFSDKNPAAVYLIDYTYRNLGYERNGNDELYISIDSSIIDSAGQMGYRYPNLPTHFPQMTPIGATCKAQAIVGVDTAGDFMIRVNQYDSSFKKQMAEFSIDVE